MERNVEGLAHTAFGRTKVTVNHFVRRLRMRVEHLLIQRGFIVLMIGFLLGRAVILSKITPFGLPFFVAVFMWKRERAGLAFVSLMVGSLTVSLESSIFLFATMMLFLVVAKFFKHLLSLKVLPFIVFAVLFVTKMTMLYVTTEVSMYSWMIALVEAGLGFILILLNLQCVPLLEKRSHRHSIQPEEVISIMILVASMMTGFGNVTVYDLSLEHIVSRYIVLILAFVAGSALGSTVGVVTGLVLSLANTSNLYQMSLLAFAGLLSGLLRDGKKLGTSLGLLVSTLLLGLYQEGVAEIWIALSESFVAVAMFLITPNSFVDKMAKHVPGTSEYMQEQQQYVRKIRDVTAQRVSQFSSVFQALSESFAQFSTQHVVTSEHRQLDYLLSDVTEKTCQTCFKKDQCWAANFSTTYEQMGNIVEQMEEGTWNANTKGQREWDRYCVKSQRVNEVMQERLAHYQAHQRLKQQVQESRQLVAEQLHGVSQVMSDFAEEMKKERQHHYVQEEQLMDALQQFGIDIASVEVYSLEKGRVDIEMNLPYEDIHGEAEKLIAPTLSDILDENIAVKKEFYEPFMNGCRVSFGSAKTFSVDIGVAHAAKDGDLVSGDSYSTIEMGVGKYAVAISDGMGNGERAAYESNETLNLLQKILQSGIDEQIAIKSINSILSLRTTDEIFATLDLAVIDLQSAETKFLKIGSTPSFIKRGNQVIKIEVSNLPIGIIQDFEVEVIYEQLKAGDLLIMMSDGVGLTHLDYFEEWLEKKILDMETTNPQQIADIIMEEVIRSQDGYIDDDMTLVVAKIGHNTPKWSTIPVGQYLKVGKSTRLIKPTNEVNAPFV